ncbi:hypothetical protein AYO44_08105 [Planctomycetaceae bacterium SCGC AG-212-F19]|nr:hypothetical protein AYO44_08105 [Planctomycetaceae bacterium SCGC AG-212-F19]
MRTFEFTDEKSNKFWNIELQGTKFTVIFGRIGTAGQMQTKMFADEAKAQAAHDKLVAEKLGKGYVETTRGAAAAPAATAAPSPLQQSLEQAILDNPDDIATHSAYADFLSEQGDPRGEFIQVQLALEDTKRSAKERAQLEERESELLKKHARTWLGELGRFLVGKWSGPDKPYHYQFARGWLDVVRLLPFPAAVAVALARTPQARLLRRLEVVYDMRYHPFEFDKFTEGPTKALTPQEKEDEGEWHEASVPASLFESPHLTNLRVLKLGFSDTGERVGHSTMVSPFENCEADQVIGLLQKCRRLDELYLNTNLPGIERLFALPALGQVRVLQYYYGTEYAGRGQGSPYPLNTLAKNKALTRLTHLRLHPGRDTTLAVAEVDAILKSPNLSALTHLQLHMTNYGDDGCRRLVPSGILKRLKELDIGYGNMTDEGARILAGCPDLKRLEQLDVTRNALTDKGIAALKAVGIRVIAENQHDAGEEDYLYEVDFE